MTLLYLSADKVGTQTGGGVVTANELLALQELAGERGEECWDITDVPMPNNDPFEQDRLMLSRLKSTLKCCHVFPKLAHLYSGCTPDTVSFLKQNGCKVCYTVAAHDRHVSRREHEALGLSFPYPHLTEERLWNKYIHGYRLADVIVCPGTVPQDTVKNYGADFAKKDIRIIAHGCHLPEKVAPLPKMFTVGYLGSVGPDKGLRYLLAAWKWLAYKDAVLILAGRDSTSQFAFQLVKTFGGGNIQMTGWQNDVRNFYNQISCYVQPSATEGFGIEVLESISHFRPVVCSLGAGACDLINEDCGVRVSSCDPAAIAQALEIYHQQPELLYHQSQNAGEMAKSYTWEIIRERYKELWQKLLR